MDAATDTLSLEQEVRNARWYHTLELPGGIVTPGEYDLRGIVDRLPWPDLTGKRCLDIGSRDGFYAFEMERRGAREVVSLDIDDPDLIHFPGGVAPSREAIQSELDAGNRAFELASRALASRVQREYGSIYDLSRNGVGVFDFAVIGTLLLHLRDPVGGLAAAQKVIDGEILINEAVTPGLDLIRRRPVADLFMRDGPFWWINNPAGLRRMAEAAGFEVVRSGRPYLIPHGEGRPPKPWRAVLRRPFRDIAPRALNRRGAVHVWVLASSRAGQ